MSVKGKLLVMAFIAVAFLSALGLLSLFTLRFEKGDVFPAYSSLRSDPLGCKAFFMALDRSAGLTVRRNFRGIDRLKGSQGRTIYFLGSREALLDAASDKRARELETLAAEGNRLVIAFTGQNEGHEAVKEIEDKEADRDEQKKAAESAKPCAERVGAWGLKIGLLEPSFDPARDRPRAALSVHAPELPPAIPVHSRHRLEGGGKNWRPVYCYRDGAVVLERVVGKGSIVVMAESYLFSNEALRSDRCPGLLAWLQCPERTALFDESHLGVYDSPGVMELVKKHRLVPFLLALLALAALYIWKSAVPFVTASLPAEGSMSGGARDNFGGLVNLLRRNIAPGNVITACFGEWSRSFSREIGQNPDLAGQLQVMVNGEKAGPPGKRDPVGAYRKMAGLLANFRAR